MLAEHFLSDIARQFGELKSRADSALARTPDEAFFTSLDEESNSVAVLVKHVAGNARSRWRDFLTSDGEKPDRFRDGEFVAGETREELMTMWEDGWTHLFDTLDDLEPDDLMRTVAIRGQVHTVVEALNRSVSHYAYHVGQIVFLAKHHAGKDWESLSIPRGETEAHNRAIWGSERHSGLGRA
jgi:hypothetical protein